MVKRACSKVLSFLLSLAVITSSMNVPVMAATTEVTEITSETTTQEVVLSGNTVDSTEWDGVTTESVFETDGLKVTFKLLGTWQGGYNANIRLDNMSDVPIENWKIQTNYEGVISNIWNAVIESNEPANYVIKNAGWNQDIATGSYVEFGFSGQEDFCGFPTNYDLIGEQVVTNEEEYVVDYTVQSDWGAGFNGLITITNNSEKAIEDWVLEFEGDNTISNIWDGVIVSHEERKYVVKNADYNQNILVGKSVSFGFTVSSGDASREFTNFVLTKYADEEIPTREKEPLQSIGEAYCKEPTEADIVTDEETGLQYVRNQLLVSAYMGADKAIFEEIAVEVGAKIVGYIELTNDYQFEFTENKTMDELQTISDYIDSYSFVSAVTLNIIDQRVTEVTTTNDSQYNDNKTNTTEKNKANDDWNENSPGGDNWGLEALHVLSAWDNKSTFSPVKVGVYDASFLEHEDIIFDDIANNSPTNSAAHHGTFCSGIIAAKHNNARGISGVATDVRLYAYGSRGSDFGSSMGDKLAYATLIGNHVKVINVSLGSDDARQYAASHDVIEAQNAVRSEADVLEEYLNKLVAAGYDFVICTSAGNVNDDVFVEDDSADYGYRKFEDRDKGKKTYTGDVDAYYNCGLTAIQDENLKKRIIVVGAMANCGNGNYVETIFSNIGNRVDFMAPGKEVLGCFTGGYKLSGGTSYASPYVAGLVALMYQTNTGLNASHVKEYMTNSSSKTIETEPYSYKIPDAVVCCEYAKNASSYNGNTNIFPSGIICGYTKTVLDNAVTGVKITAVRKSTGEYNLGQYSFTMQSDSKGYYLKTLPQGTYDLLVSADGYLPYAIQNIVVTPDETLYMENIILSKWVSIAYKSMAVQGVVKDALKGTAVSGATVKLRKGWNSRSGAYVKTLFGEERKATTASDGSFSIVANMGIYTAEITKNGFITGYYNVVSGDTGSFSNYSKTTMVLTPRLSDDEYRIILTWGQTPTDLDSHLTYYVDNVQKFHVSYLSKVANYEGVTVAKLDLDDTSSYGPETVTITLDANLVRDGGRFQYSVHDFSGKSNTVSKQLSLSGAAVQIYAGNNRVKTFYVPKNQMGTVWHVFDITEDGVVAVNNFYNSTSAGGVK